MLACLLVLAAATSTAPTPPAAASSTPAPLPTVLPTPTVRVGRSFPLSGQGAGADLTVDVIVAAADGEAHGNAALDEVERVLTLFDARRDDSPLARLNQSAGKEAQVIDPEVFAVLTSLQRVARLSKGAYDVTSAVFDDAWSFGADAPESAEKPAKEKGPERGREKERPQKSEIDRLRQLVSVDDLVLDPVARTARLKKAGSRVDLHSVVAGHALDRARAVLLGRGVVDFVLSVGGDVVVNGMKGDRPWMVGVQDPRAAGPFLALPVDGKELGGAVMTSSDNDSFFVIGGSRYHSILDPRSGLPGTRSRSVTVLFDEAVVAEALSRAVFILGAADGMKLIERLPGANAVIVTADNRVVLSKGLQKLAKAQMLQQRPPTDGP